MFLVSCDLFGNSFTRSLFYTSYRLVQSFDSVISFLVKKTKKILASKETAVKFRPLMNSLENIRKEKIRKIQPFLFVDK